jgi:hypothetical protein
MFEHFFDANSPCAGLVSATDPCPCTGLPPLVLFGRGYVFAKDIRTEIVLHEYAWPVAPGAAVEPACRATQPLLSLHPPRVQGAKNSWPLPKNERCNSDAQPLDLCIILLFSFAFFAFRVELRNLMSRVELGFQWREISC